MPILELSLVGGEASLDVRRFSVHEAISSLSDFSPSGEDPKAKKVENGRSLMVNGDRNALAAKNHVLALVGDIATCLS